MSEEYYHGYTSICSYIRSRNEDCSFREFVELYKEMIIESPPNTDDWTGLEVAWRTRFLGNVERIIPEKYVDIDAKVVSETSKKSLMSYWQNIINEKRRHSSDTVVSKISSFSSHEDQEFQAMDADSLPKKRSRTEKEDATQEDLLNSVTEASNTFSKIDFPTYYDKLKTIWHTNDAEANYYVIDLGDVDILSKTRELLDDEELKSLFERLTLDDENNHISTKASEYLTLFDQLIEYPLEGKATEDDNTEKNIKDKVISEIEETIHGLNDIPTKFRYLSNTLPLPVLQFDQSQYSDLYIIKSISSHIDGFTKMKGILENTSERSWTAHILSFLDSIQYFSCERTIPTKLDLQVTDYKADGVAEFFKRPNQIPMFLLEVSGDPNKPDPDKFNNDRQKLMKEGVFALNKFMTRTKLPTWDVCKTLGIFLAQGYSNNLEIGQMIYIGPGLYFYSPFTVPSLIIPTSDTELEHTPRLIRTFLCLRFNVIEKIKRFKEFERRGYLRVMKPMTNDNY
ncbi:2457_t:CDS:2 [Diversispora eburnea]|uniref:2457_t:CDS:1 n=1 Tax=Diversispora eburnea TaxID=1213867 RepID=A0A9N9FM99_9GLOM|nr:2457_t:CDS:2 [Diversispora eburnea]